MVKSQNHFFGAAAVIAMAAAVTIVQFRIPIRNGFEILFGDRYDTVIVDAILEHWYNVVRGLEPWSQILYFYPNARTLGHTDGYFLCGIVYSAYRSLGIDPFVSAELTNISLRTAGVVTMFVACRNIFGIPYWWSIACAATFGLADNHVHRLQFATACFAPLLALLAWKALKEFRAGSKGKFVVVGGAAGVLFGAWAITCFYMAWFFAYFACFLIGFYLLLQWLDKCSFPWRQIKDSWPHALIVATIALLSVWPLLWVYLFKAGETGFRPYPQVMQYTVPVYGILQVGEENFVFGTIYNRLLRLISMDLSIREGGEYYNTGMGPILFVLFLGGVRLAFQHKERRTWSNFGLAFALASVTSWIFTLRVSGHSAWYFIYQLVPGAKSLQVVSAYQIFLIAPVSVIAFLYLANVSARLPALIAFIVVSGLMVEEFGSGFVTLVRKDELARISLAVPPPAQCRVFFVTGWPDQDTGNLHADSVHSVYAHNVTAMFIAELYRVPTINGIASFNPPGWDFAFPNRADYMDRIRRYTERYKIDGLCKLDLNTGSWSVSW